MKHNEQEFKEILQQISDVLLINGGFLSSPGLYFGEMGLVLFFACYARYTQNFVYLDYAYDLMENIQNRIHQHIPISYKHGLTGIGSAIEYLVQNDFFKANTDEVLEEFDQSIFFRYNLSYLTIEEITDVGCYAQWRLSGKSAKNDMIRQFVMPQIEKAMHDHSFHPVSLQMNRTSMPDSFKDKTLGNCIELIESNSFWGNNMGLYNGLAGWGLSLLTELDGNNSWFSLFPNEIIIKV